MEKRCCGMRGLLTFLVLWIISRAPASGADVAREIEARRGKSPSPGTLYPVLKSLKEQGLVELKAGKYVLTHDGHEELTEARALFTAIFYDRDEICKGKGGAKAGRAKSA